MLLADGAIVVWLFVVFVVGLLGFFWVLATLIVRALTWAAAAIAGLLGLRGPAAEVHHLGDDLLATKGVLHGEVIVTSGEGAFSRWG